MSGLIVCKVQRLRAKSIIIIKRLYNNQSYITHTHIRARTLVKLNPFLFLDAHLLLLVLLLFFEWRPAFQLFVELSSFDTSLSSPILLAWLAKL